MYPQKTLHALCLSFLFLSPPIMASDETATEEETYAEETLNAADVARELANPNTSLASLVFKNQYITFTGDLPDAGAQTSALTIFQPILPFPLESGSQVIFRPAIPVIWDAPAGNSFNSESGIGDISFDLVYALKSDNGFITALGVASTLPTATNGKLGNNKFSLGPDILFGRVTKEYVLGLNPSHQWSLLGSGDKNTSSSRVQLFAALLLGEGWNVGSQPIITYDWKQSEWEIPLNLIVSKTVMIGGRPWKLGTELNYYVDQNDDFGPRWMFGINITPVITNGLATLFQ